MWRWLCTEMTPQSGLSKSRTAYKTLCSLTRWLHKFVALSLLDVEQQKVVDLNDRVDGVHANWINTLRPKPKPLARYSADHSRLGLFWLLKNNDKATRYVNVDQWTHYIRWTCRKHLWRTQTWQNQVNEKKLLFTQVPLHLHTRWQTADRCQCTLTHHFWHSLTHSARYCAYQHLRKLHNTSNAKCKAPVKAALKFPKRALGAQKFWFQNFSITI